jgi:hypothetical protein
MGKATAIRTRSGGRRKIKVKARSRASSRTSRRSSVGSRPRSRLARRTVKQVQAKVGRAVASDFHSKQGIATVFESMMMNPVTARGLRYRDESSTVASATATFHTNLALVQTAASVINTYAYFNGGIMAAYLFRDPLRALVYYRPNSENKAYSYTANFTTVGTITYALAATVEPQQVDFLYLPDTNYTNIATIHPHGPSLFPGLALGRKAIWMDSGSTMTIVLSSTTAASVLVTLAWNGKSFDVYATTAVSTATFTYNASKSGYFAFEVVLGASPNAASITAVLTGTTDVMAHNCCATFDGQLSLFNQTRVVAASLLLSNEASALYAEGNISMAQFPASVNFWQVTNIESVMAVRETWSGKAALGAYGWLKPGDASDFIYRTNIVSTGSVVYGCSFDLQNQGEFLACFVKTASVTGPLYPGADFLLSACHALEFTTTSQVCEVEYCMMSTSMRQAAMDRLAYATQFFENPFHLTGIRNFFAGGLHLLRKHATKIGAAIGTLFPGVAAVSNAIGSAISY